MSGVIFEDLGIDWTTMVSDPDGFDQSCREKGEELKTILKSSNSVTSYLKALPKEDFDFKAVDKSITDFWFMCDKEVPTTNLSDVAVRLRKLASEIEYIAQSRALLALAESNQGMDKSFAHEQYTRLREAHKDWAKSMKFLGKYSCEPMPAMPGNYGSEVRLDRYVFLFQGDDDYMMDWNSVCKRIGVPPMNMMDTVEYVESHPETNCTVTRVTK